MPPWPPGLALEDRWEQRVLPALVGPATGDDILTEAEDFVPDVVVDCILGAGLEAARCRARWADLDDPKVRSETERLAGPYRVWRDSL